MSTNKTQLRMIALIFGATCLLAACGNDTVSPIGNTTTSAQVAPGPKPGEHHNEEAFTWCGRKGTNVIPLLPAPESGKTGEWPPTSDADADFVKVGNLEIYYRARKAAPENCERVYWFGTQQTARTNGHYQIWVEVDGTPGTIQRSEPSQPRLELISFTAYAKAGAKVALCIQETDANGTPFGDIARVEITSV